MNVSHKWDELNPEDKYPHFHSTKGVSRGSAVCWGVMQCFGLWQLTWQVHTTAALNLIGVAERDLENVTFQLVLGGEQRSVLAQRKRRWLRLFTQSHQRDSLWSTFVTCCVVMQGPVNVGGAVTVEGKTKLGSCYFFLFPIFRHLYDRSQDGSQGTKWERQKPHREAARMDGSNKHRSLAREAAPCVKPKVMFILKFTCITHVTCTIVQINTISIFSIVYFFLIPIPPKLYYLHMRSRLASQFSHLSV